jgi:hypothetical protein
MASGVPGAGWASTTYKTEQSPLVANGVKPVKPDGLLNISTNVILHFRLHSLERMSTINFALAVLSLAYLAVNVVMIIFNLLMDDDCDDPDSVYIVRCESPVSDYAFHMLEFWATFGFAIIQAYALLNTPKTLSTIYERPFQLKLVIFFDIVASLVPVMFVTFDMELFEIVSHEIEYCNELTMSFVDLVILASLVRVGHRRGCPAPTTDTSSTSANVRAAGDVSPPTLASVALMTAALQLLLYNGMGMTPDGEMRGEKAAHYCEFLFEIMSALISFMCVLLNDSC